MSPKKRQRRKPAPQRPRTTEQDQSAPTKGEDTQDTGRPRTDRTPLVLPDPPDKRITALWVALAVLWALGTPLALANLLFTAMDMQEAALATSGDPTAPAPAPDMSSVGNALIWVLVLALAVPAASAVAAAIVRRKIAAIGFTAALVVSAVPLFWVMPPPDLWDALRAHLSG